MIACSQASGRRRCNFSTAVSLLSALSAPAGVAALYELSTPSMAQAGTASEGGWLEDVISVENDKGKEIKKTIRVWNPKPGVYKDFNWDPADHKDLRTDRQGSIEGTGKLTWVNASDEPIGPIYWGDMKGGRPEGHGRMEDVDGSEYVGDWRQGEPNGRGVSTSADGDLYEGQFVDGKPNGVGRYASADGRVIDGAGTPISPDALRGDPGVHVRVFVDKETNRKFAAQDEVFPSYFYDTDTVSGDLRLTLNSPEIIAEWKDGGSAISGAGAPEHIEGDGQFAPANLRVKILNAGAGELKGSQLYLEVNSSIVDARPYVAIVGNDVIEGCGELNLSYDPTIKFVNYGSGPALSPKLRFSIGYGENRSSEDQGSMGDIIDDRTFSIEGALERLGVKTAALKKSEFKCPSGHTVKCLRGKSKYLGKAQQFVGSLYNDALITTHVEGSVSYKCKDEKGVDQAVDLPFVTDVPLFTLDANMTAGECGGGEPADRAKKPTLALKSSAVNYTVPVPDNFIRAPGSDWGLAYDEVPTSDEAPSSSVRAPDSDQAPSVSRDDFAISVSAPMSSSHTFRFVAKTADGKVYKSRNIFLDYFAPRQRARKPGEEGTDQ